MKIYRLFFVLCSFLFFSCTEYTPKPMAYPRIEKPVDTIAQTYQTLFFLFTYPAQPRIAQSSADNKEEYWFNISYPHYDAVVYCTYLPVTKQSLKGVLDDSYKLAYNHALKANGIKQTLFANEANHVYGIIYDIDGSVAVPFQFFATDSVSNFLRGSLYYNKAVNADSVAPATRYMREDIEQLMESLVWKQRK